MNELVEYFKPFWGQLVLVYGSWCVGMSAVLKAFDTVDKRLSDEARADVGRYILNVDMTSRLSGLARIFNQAFATVFGPKHFTLKCYFRSVLASLITSALVCTLILPLGLRDGVIWFELAPAIFWFALIPDYLSIGKSRILIRLMETGSVGRILALLVADIIASVAIALVWFAVIFGLSAFAISRAFENYLGASSTLEDLGFVIFGIGFEYYPLGAIGTCLTSLWAILFAFSVFIVRSSKPLSTTGRMLGYALDFRKKPFGSVGFVLVVLATVGFASVRAVAWIVSSYS